MKENTADQLFNYLRDVLYDSGNATLAIDSLDEEYKMLGEGMQYFCHCVQEQRELAKALSKGNLTVKLPPPNNELAAPLKALHASLKHLTWQAEQVAKGDYQQRLDFMGEFAEAFNTMTKQLDHRQRALEQEILTSQRKTEALQQSNSLLESITDKMSQWIIVVDKSTKKQLFMNSAAKLAIKQDKTLKKSLYGWFREQDRTLPIYSETPEEVEMKFVSDGQAYYYSVASYPIHWKDHSAIAYIFTDVSVEKEQMQRLESYAYQDTLTKMNNRFYGMGVLRDWLTESRCFSICFADLDNFKYVNDNFGHSEGDKYIIRAAELLVHFAPDSVAARLGGDEFMVLAPGYTQKQAEMRMKEIRRSLMDGKKYTDQIYLSSLSYGVVEINEENTVSASDLLAIADERMYAFKRAHRVVRGVACELSERDKEEVEE